MKLFITGVSGTGKTTLGRKLKQKGFSVIDIDEDGLCHWYEKQTGNIVDYKADLNKEFISNHVWICDIDKLNKFTEEVMSPVFIIGMPENINDIISLSDKVILLKCSPEIFISRILKREDNDYGKDITAQEEILNMYSAFEDKINKLGAIGINTEISIDEVVEKVLNNIN